MAGVVPMISSIKNNIRNFVFNVPGWHTNRKIVVFESDDWGMIRMASKDIYEYLLKKGYPVDECWYNRNDTLETNDDLEKLYDVLLMFKDKYDNHPVITANHIVANPDFDKIKETDFQSYFYEPFNKTLNKYPGRDRVLSLYHEGIKKGIFIPQLHGREHVNISNWLEALNSKDSAAIEIFNLNMFTAHVKKNCLSCSKEYLDAFGGQYGNIKFNIQEIITDAGHIFEQLYGFKSQSFIAPCYTWPISLNEGLCKIDIKYIQGGNTQKVPKCNKKEISKSWHYTGQRNKYNQIFLTRNASLEVAENPNKDWVNSSLKEIETAFKFYKPAIISIHRVNFMGGINKQNRDKTLQVLVDLIKKLLTIWPEIEFMSSDMLGNIISE